MNPKIRDSQGFEVTVERMDDAPLLLGQMTRLGLPQLLDESYQMHGNWGDLSFGWTVCIWLAHILSQADHRMNRVQPWVESLQETLSHCCGNEVRPLDLSDERLASVLSRFSETEAWQEFEGACGRQWILVYDLELGVIRLDSTTSCGYFEVTEDGLFQYGKSKDHRPDLPQLKVMLATLDPLGLPLVTTVVSGEKADDPLYIPAVVRVRDCTQKRGLLYVGDSKMAALPTRAFIVAGGDLYLTPIPKRHLTNEVFESYLQVAMDEETELQYLYPEGTNPEQLTEEERNSLLLACGHEVTEKLTTQVDGQEVSWEERRLVIRSVALAQKQAEKLDRKLQKVLESIEAVNERKQGKKVPRCKQELAMKLSAMVQEKKLSEYIALDYEVVEKERVIRGYKGKPDRKEFKTEVIVRSTLKQQEIEEAKRKMGWRVLSTNADEEKLPFEKALVVYRDNYTIDVNNFKRLKGKPLSLRPMYVQCPERAVGLVRLLSLGLRVMMMLEFVVHRSLKEKESSLGGLYPGNPKRTTKRPRAELMLESFKGLNLSTLIINGEKQYHLTTLNKTQSLILELAELPSSMYESLSFEGCVLVPDNLSVAEKKPLQESLPQNHSPPCSI